MIERVTRAELESIVSNRHDHISGHDRDEMAIPTYLHGNSLIRWLMWRRYEVIAELMRLDGSEVVFEFGCGTGVFLPQLAASSKTVFATDLFPEYASTLSERRELGVHFVVNTDALEDASVDVIIAADVLEHITDLQPYLKAFAAKLKNDGRLVISGPTENLAYRIGRFLAGFSGKGDYHHTNIDHLLDEISAYGFRRSDGRNLPFALAPHLFRIAVFQK